MKYSLFSSTPSSTEYRKVTAEPSPPSLGIFFEAELVSATEFLLSVVTTHIGTRQIPRAVVVQHLVPNTLPFISALSSIFESITLIPKPNSINENVRRLIIDQFPRLTVADVRRTDLHNQDVLNQLLFNVGSHKTIIFDMGGYFAPIQILNRIIEYNCVLGIIEDTQNGHLRYEESWRNTVKSTSICYFSVANSPLKETEDYLVGTSIVFSAEERMRNFGESLHNKTIGVLGYGKIGRSIAHALKHHTPDVSVYDQSSVRAVQALAHGLLVEKRVSLLKKSSVIFCATGNKSIHRTDLHLLRDRTALVSCTSRDDEFGFEIHTPSDGGEPANNEGHHHAYW